MAQGEQRCSNSSSGGGGGGVGGGGRSCKKPKQKKIPQRGLGVAQLEKMRLEELQKKEAAAAGACFVVPFPPKPPSSVSFIPPLSDLPSSPLLPPNSIFKTSVPISGFDLFASPPIPPFPRGEGDGVAGIGGQGVSIMWNGFDLNEKAQKSDLGFQFHPHLHEDLNPVWHSPPLLQRNQQYLSPFLVNALPPSSSGVNLQMEPPSNQSYCSNPMPPPPTRVEEERMVGMKRPWPFYLENPLGGIAPFHCKFPPSSPICERRDESSNAHNDPLKFNSGDSILRDGTSCSINRLNPTKNSKENGSLDGEFLTLGLPPASSNLKSKQPMSSRLDIIPFQGITEDIFMQSGPPPTQQQTFYSFLSTNASGGNEMKGLNEWRSGGVDSVDLNLKL